MHNLPTYIDAHLAKKYNFRVFMYTEYPHKSFWSREFNQQDHETALKSLFSQKKDTALMLYVHIPFCPVRCFYCTCHTIVTKDYAKVKNYLNFLLAEIDLWHKFFAEHSITPNFREVHLGGGSPTVLDEKEFSQLIEKIQSIVEIKNLSEFSIEIDPRRVDKGKMKYYHTMGINRISFGVQDFNLKVQKAINRVQPPELTENLLTPEIRRCFAKGVNFDIICGLPWQTRATIRETFKRIVKMSPDRICFNYLHYSPKFAKHQTLMSDGRNGRPSKLPDFYEKKMLFKEALNILVDNGYMRTGYDHFAKPDDDLTKAMQKKTMHWNALGVTSGRYQDVIGVGLHSYSTMGIYYSQNVFELADYEAALSDGKFPVYRGHKLTQDDLIRRDVIKSLRNFFFLNYRDIEKKYNIKFKEYFKQESVALAEFVKEGILELSDDTIKITELGHQFADVVCRNFDHYLPRIPF